MGLVMIGVFDAMHRAEEEKKRGEEREVSREEDERYDLRQYSRLRNHFLNPKHPA
jgi:hypothetical protein